MNGDEDMPPISVMIKPASGLCNMKCDYCFYSDEAKKRTCETYGYMTEQTLKNVIRKTIRSAEYYVNYAFQGGEPTLRGIEFFEKAVKFQEKFNKHGIAVNNSIQTNGYNINEDWCKFLKNNNFLVGLSIDGTQYTHDFYRHDKNGATTFDRIKKAAELMSEYSIKYNILTVVNDKVASNILEIYSYYKENGWNYQQYIACLDPLDEKRGEKKYALRQEQYGKFLIQLFNLWYEDWEKNEQPYIRQFDNYIAILLGYQPESCEQRGTCGIQNVVEADGSVFPCDFYMTDDYYIGNYNYDQTETIDEKRREIGFVARSTNISDECRECKYIKICRNGCQRCRDKDDITGKYRNYFCESYKMFFDECLDKMEYIASYIAKKN